ncbi:MAG: hypothetical protein COS14_03945 [Bacteroidetes bacterium CG02_land_8_20_14_3_00_31_25]|nr:MAG: hypothetical protein COS14_03945 [Bacteroidetes bacterium CG02_land_8_20_14_3_00_31_25]
MKTLLFSILILSFCKLFAQNYGINFSDADNNYIITPNNSAINVTNNFTIEFWMRPSKTFLFACLLDKGKCSNNSASFDIFTQTDSTLNFGSNNDGHCTYTNIYTCNTKVLPGSCIHVALSYSSSGAKFYYNGVLQAGHYTQGNFAGTLHSNSESLRIAHYIFVDESLGAFYDGMLDELRIWNRVLTPTEILSNYQNHLNGNETGLQLYYKFDNQQNGPGMTVYNSATATGSALNGLTYSNNSATPFSNNPCFAYTKIEENILEPKDFNVFPNPTTGKITVKGEKIIICNILGEPIYTLLLKEEFNDIDLSNFKSGVYFVKIFDNKKFYTVKLLKQ